MKPLFLTLLVISGALFADDPKISAELGARQAHVGDPVSLTVRIVYGEPWVFEPAPIAEELDEARVLKQAWNVPPEQQPDAAEKVLILTAEVSWYDLGEMVLPEIKIIGTNTETNQAQEFPTPELMIEITALLEEGDEALAPQKGQVTLDIPPTLMILMIAGALLVLLVLALIIWWLRKREKVVPEKVIPALPPYEEAMKALEELTSGSLLKEGRVKEFYVAVNLIVRHYYSRLFNINAEEMTSFEMEEWLEVHREVSAEIVALNRAFQDLCDQVKFAKYDPPEAENQENVNRAYTLVEKLKPQSQPRENEGEQEEDNLVAAG